jgi:hypothetical protein
VIVVCKRRRTGQLLGLVAAIKGRIFTHLCKESPHFDVGKVSSHEGVCTARSRLYVKD